MGQMSPVWSSEKNAYWGRHPDNRYGSRHLTRVPGSMEVIVDIVWYQIDANIEFEVSWELA